MRYDERERVYGREEYYWGTKPNELARETVEAAPDAEDTLTAIDIGAGEGRDAVFFAEQGWNVYAMDVSPNGLAKAERLAESRGVTLSTIEADANDATLPDSVDVVYSTGAIQYIRPENRERQFDRFKNETTADGIHAMFAFVDHPEVPTPPDWTENEHFYAQGELAEYYEEWEIVRVETFVFDDDSGDEPHRHAAEILFARNPS
ncbi:methyltransferase domain-containing protein [Halosolutus halophilus]|uniref:methyltransferase domain-containing protein n=1 Tax=Halosolutus halophilus TaxID=1552990 RepID=UPI0022351998|nr:methyltransferase domain-containing protein [Halosolutus halophilus]